MHLLYRIICSIKAIKRARTKGRRIALTIQERVIRQYQVGFFVCFERRFIGPSFLFIQTTDVKSIANPYRRCRGQTRQILSVFYLLAKGYCCSLASEVTAEYRRDLSLNRKYVINSRLVAAKGNAYMVTPIWI